MYTSQIGLRTSGCKESGWLTLYTEIRRTKIILFSGWMTMVKCEICGGYYNERFLKSHKRLSHSKKAKSSNAKTPDAEIVEQILALLDRLSAESSRELIKKLISTGRHSLKDA